MNDLGVGVGVGGWYEGLRGLSLAGVCLSRALLVPAGTLEQSSTPSLFVPLEEKAAGPKHPRVYGRHVLESEGLFRGDVTEVDSFGAGPTADTVPASRVGRTHCSLSGIFGADLGG